MASAADTSAPTVPGNFRATRASPTQINLNWNAATDNVGVAEYRLERCQGSGCTNFKQFGSTVGQALANWDPGLVPTSSFSYRVRAVDTTGNVGGYSATATVAATGSGDTQAPTVPAGLRLTRAAGTEIDLSWTAATDNVGIREYRVERCQGTGCTAFTQIGSSVGPYLANWDPVLVTTASFSYRVRAVDTSGNLSGYSATATMAATGGTGTTGTATVSWTPPLQRTDGSALTNLAGYEIRYGRSASALTSTVRLSGTGLTRYVINGLTSGTWHFGVVAYDTANRNSDLSAIRTKTIP